jgi:predicted nucleic acid-binding protein
MIVVADTSPINYLVLIEEIEILPKIYGRAVIPQTVYDELVRPSAPQAVQYWVTQKHIWLEIRSPSRSVDVSIADLDAGERDAIALAQELRADRLIIDDQEGRREAEKLGLPVSGTLGVLRDAAALQLLDLRSAVQRLQSTSFRVAPEILASLLNDHPD